MSTPIRKDGIIFLRRVGFALLRLLTLVWIAAIQAAAGQSTAFTYQGQLREAGVPVNGSANFVFGLWDAPEVGSRIGTPVTLNAVAVSNGLFTVELDFGANGFTGSARWLEIAVNGTALGPRQAITPVPMALYALTPTGPAGPVGATGPPGPAGATGPAGPEGLKWRGAWSSSTGYAIDDAVSHNGSSWMAKAGSTGSAPAEGSANWDLVAKKGDTGAAGPQGPAGPAGPSGAFNRTGTNATFSGGNVGIGTTNPQAELHVRTAGDGIRIQGAAGGDVNQAYLSFMDNPGSRIGYVGDGSTGDQSVFLNADIGDVVLNTAAGRVLTATSGGNVGIGTTAPTAKLEVAGNTRINGTFLLVNPLGSVILDGNRNNTVSYVTFYVYANAYKTEGGSSWGVLSDRRLKQDVRPFEPGLNEILQLRPVRFRYRDDPKRGLTSAQEEVGFIAQEIREVIPEAVAEGEDGYLSLKADPIHWATINAIQQLNTNLEAAVKEKDARITALEQSVAELKELVSALAQAKGGAR